MSDRQQLPFFLRVVETFVSLESSGLWLIKSGKAMPLLTIAGLPLAGKTFAASALIVFLEPLLPPGMSICLVSSDTLGLDKIAAAECPQVEKASRGSILAAVERALSPSTLVIVDDYATSTKGLRYQLFRFARAVQSPTATLFVAVSRDIVRDRQDASIKTETYSKASLEDLCDRFEEPDGHKARWDSPLFTLLPDDDVSAMFGRALLDVLCFPSLIKKTVPAESLATMPASLSAPNYVAELDAVVSQGLQYIADAQRSGFPGGMLVWQKASKKTPFRLPSRSLSSTELRRLKKQFLGILQRGPIPLGSVPGALIDYVNLQLSR